MSQSVPDVWDVEDASGKKMSHNVDRGGSQSDLRVAWKACPFPTQPETGNSVAGRQKSLQYIVVTHAWICIARELFFSSGPAEPCVDCCSFLSELPQ